MLSAKTYNCIVKKLRCFFADHKKFMEVPAQSRHAILTAYNPKTLATYSMSGMQWALPQSGQMILEHELLRDQSSSYEGVYCITASYSSQDSPIFNGQQKLFPLFEFESRGEHEQLKDLEKQLLQYLGFSEPREFSYEALCQHYNVDLLESKEQSKIWEELGDVISLQNFPERTNPFFTIKRDESGISQKVDLILYGIETVVSAQRSCNIDQMRHDFFTLRGGAYAQTLFETFGKQRVIAELENFLAQPMVPRFSGSISICSLARAMELANILDEDFVTHHRDARQNLTSSLS